MRNEVLFGVLVDAMRESGLDIIYEKKKTVNRIDIGIHVKNGVIFRQYTECYPLSNEDVDRVYFRLMHDILIQGLLKNTKQSQL